MHRRPLGRGRRLAVIGAIVILVGCVLPWYTLGGGSGLPTYSWWVLTLSENGAGPGMLSFLAALLTIALVTLPYATAGRPVGVDAWPAYLVFLVLALIGAIGWPLQVAIWSGGPGGFDVTGFAPDKAPGYWIAVIGTIVLARAVFEIHQEPAVL